jgi:hypothetical protein
MIYELVRAAIREGLGALETLTEAMGRARGGRLKPGERRYERMVVDRLAQRIVAWQEIVSDEPEFVRPLKALAERVRGLQPSRRLVACAGVRRRCPAPWASGQGGG